jgi:hypothetical protein
MSAENQDDDFASLLAKGISGQKRELDEAKANAAIWQAQVAEAARQVEASDKLYRQMCKERDELKADTQTLIGHILNLRHAKGRHNTGIAYERLMTAVAEFQSKHSAP